MKSSIFWDTTPCSLLKVNGISQARNQREIALLPTCFHARFLLGLIFDPEEVGDMFLRNVVDFQRITRRYIPEDRILQLYSSIRNTKIL
jgi:hypothetical protein